MVGRILIVDDVATNRILLKVKLSEACYHPLVAGDGATCLRVARRERPDLILLDLTLPDMACPVLIERLRADPLTRDIPIVAISATHDLARRFAAFEAGADDVLTKPIDEQLLLARLRNLIGARAAAGELAAGGFGPAFEPVTSPGLAEAAAPYAAPALIGLLVERSETAILMRRELEYWLPDLDRVIVIAPGEAFAEGGRVPDVYVIDMDLGVAGGGLRLMSELRSRSRLRHAAFCILHRPDDTRSIAMAMDLGASDVVALENATGPRPAAHTIRELAVRLKAMLRRKAAADRLRATVEDGLRQAVIDPLTGLHNRRYALSRLSSIAAGAEAEAKTFAVMVCDIDRFKFVNDNWGHAAGDAVLVSMAERLRTPLREGDLLARIGGEEFLIVLPSAGLAEAEAMADRLRQMVGGSPFILPAGEALTITLSIGMAIGGSMPAPDQDPVARVVDRADRALLISKAEGRNQVTIDGGRSAA